MQGRPYLAHGTGQSEQPIWLSLSQGSEVKMNDLDSDFSDAFQ